MRRKFTDEKKREILKAYRERTGGGAEFCKEYAVNPTQLWRWGKKFDTIEPAREVVQKTNGNGSELKQLRIENQRLKLLLAEKCLDVQSLSEYCGKVA